MSTTTYNQVIIRALPGEYNQIAEFELYDQNNVNIARLGTAYQAATFQLATADNAIDGNKGTEYIADVVNNPIAVALPNTDWVLTLDREYELSELNRAVFYNRSSDSQRAIGASIILKSSTAPDELIGTCTIDLKQMFLIGDSVLPPATYNQVTITASGVQELNFAEFQLFDLADQNIAPLGTAVSSSTSFGVYGQASNGIDGNLNGFMSTNPPYNGIVHTGGGGIWTLTLDRSYSKDELSKAVLYNRTGASFGEGNRTIGVAITLVSDSGHDDYLIGTGTADDIQEFIITESSLVAVPRATSISIIIGEVDGAITYKLTIQKDGTSIKWVTHTGFTILTQVIPNLDPSTSYTVELFADTGSGYESVSTISSSTLANSAENYDTSEYGTNGSYQLKSLSPTSLSNLLKVSNDIFTTGDVIEIDIPRVKTKTAFVKRGEEVDVTQSKALLVPFDVTAGSGQSITMTLSNASTVSVAYDEVTNEISVGGTSYAAGESFSLDGKKVTVLDI